MGKAGQKWGLCLEFVISLSVFGLFFFSVLQFSSFLLPLSIPHTHAFFLTDKGYHPGQNSTQSVSNPSTGSFVPPSATLPCTAGHAEPALCHTPAGGEGESHT